MSRACRAVRSPAPKSIELAALGTLLVTLSQSTVLAALITAVSTWLGQRRERSVTLDAAGDTLELTGSPTPAERAEAAEWLSRRRSRRHALIIASYEFADPGLSSLRAPAHDAAQLASVLSDARIGGFDVQTLINTSAAEVNEAVEDFFADREPDDLLVLHFSGHGVKDEAGELHFATSGTKLNRLAATAVSADFVARRMNRSRSRRIVLLLDCCYSGAFGRGMVARAGGSLDLEEQFSGSGRAVITASSAVEYAFEGAQVADTSEGEPSVFTSALVEGLASGDADQDLDGFVGLDELYEYVYDRVRRVTPHQTPGKWMLDVRGDLRIARRAHPVSVPAALPAELQEALDHSLPGVRAGTVPELRRMLSVRHQGRALAARLALRHLTEDDSRMVAAAAREALGEHGERGDRTDLGQPAAPGSAPSASTAGKPTSAARASSASVAGSRTGADGPAAAAGPAVAAGSATAGPATAAGPTAAAGPAAVAGSATAGSATAAGPAAAAGPATAGPATAAPPGAGTASATMPAPDSGSGSGSGQADAGVPSDREPPISTLPPGSDTPAKPTNPEPRARGESQGQGRRLTLTGAARAVSGPPAAVPAASATTSATTPAASATAPAAAPTTAPAAATPAGAVPAAEPAPPPASSFLADLPARWQAGVRIAAALAFAAVVLGTVTLNDGVIHVIVNDLGPATAFLAWALPWLLAAALLATAATDHPWAPGAALGLTAGTAALMAGTSDGSSPLLIGLAATVLVFARPHWTSITASATGAGAIIVLVSASQPILGQDSDPTWPVVFWCAVVVLTALAGYRLRSNPRDAITPALLLLNAAWAVLEPGFYPYNLAFLPLLVVVPLAEILTTGAAKVAARLAIAAVVLVRASEYAYVSSLDFSRLAHVVLTLVATGAAAYFSRSR
ncbi:caspase family protein [Lentzea sp. NPDC005914]|uniref:caspase family protein n=1 Tax=Lentzea sp. NPDC005914 TaxID=3154572 RepID=UPI003406D38E